MLAACLGAAGIAAVVIIAAGASLGDSVIAEVAGLASAVAALALLGALVRFFALIDGIVLTRLCRSGLKQQS